MKKFKKPLLTLALLLVILVSFTLGAAASGTLQQISAYINSGITVKYDGEVQTMKDANGARVYPITYNGSTYLPIRAISDMLGVGVSWDQATQTVLLGDSAGGVNLIESFEPYYISSAGDSGGKVEFVQSSDGYTKTIGGETVTGWLALTSAGNTATELVGSFNLGGKYSTLTFKVYSNESTSLTVLGDNDSVLGQYSLTGGQVPQTITIDLLNTTQLSFVRSKGNRPLFGIDTYIFDAILK